MSVDRGAKGDSRQRRALQKLSDQLASSGLSAGSGIVIDPATGRISVQLLPLVSGLAVSTAGLSVLIDPAAANLLSVSSAGLKASSPLTTKGDLFTFGTNNDKLPVGSDGSVLVVDSTQPLGLKYEDRIVTTKTVHTFSALIDSVNPSTSNVDGGVLFILKAGDRPLRVKRLSITCHGRPNAAAGSASTTDCYWALCRGQGILSVPEAATTQISVMPQCLENRRVASSAILVRHSVVDMFNVTALTMYLQDNRGVLGLFPEPATGATRAKMQYYQADLPTIGGDDFIVQVNPGEALVIQTGNLFNSSSGVNPNGYIVWEEDEVILAAA